MSTTIRLSEKSALNCYTSYYPSPRWNRIIQWPTQIQHNNADIRILCFSNFKTTCLYITMKNIKYIIIDQIGRETTAANNERALPPSRAGLLWRPISCGDGLFTTLPRIPLSGARTRPDHRNDGRRASPRELIRRGGAPESGSASVDEHLPEGDVHGKRRCSSRRLSGRPSDDP